MNHNGLTDHEIQLACASLRRRLEAIRNDEKVAIRISLWKPDLNRKTLNRI